MLQFHAGHLETISEHHKYGKFQQYLNFCQNVLRSKILQSVLITHLLLIKGLVQIYCNYNVPRFI